MKRNLLSILVTLLPMVASAYDAEVDGIYYNLSGDEAEVTSGWYFETVVIPESVIYDGATYAVTSIGKNAFYGSMSLTSVTIPNSVTSIGDYAFYDCRHLPFISIPGSVVSIGNDAFNCCYELTSITIPNSVTSIGIRAFRECRELTSFIIPDGVTSINNNMFSGCKALTSVIIPNSVTSIGSSAFSGCQALASVIIPDGVASIGSGAFSGCQALTSVIFPDGVTSIANDTFYGCHSLNSFNISSNVTEIGNHAFYNCYSLKSVNIPNNVTVIGNSAFSGCSSLDSATIGSGVTSIGDLAFRECYFTTGFINNSALTFSDYWGVTICDEETSDGLLIKNNMVVKCRPWATTANIPNSVTGIGENAFRDHIAITSVTISEYMKEIGDYAFSGCKLLTSVTIPDSVTSIGSDAFSGCVGLSFLSVGKSVKSIGMSAFKNCTNLENVYCYAEEIPKSPSMVFSFNNRTPIASATLHVPAGSVDKYKATAPWNRFQNIVAIIEPSVTFTKDQMATIILPTAPDAGKGKYYRLDKCEDGKIIFEQEKQPQPHIPYIIVPSEDFCIDPGTLDLAGLSPDTISRAGIHFIGSYSREEPVCQEGWYIDIIDTTPDCGFAPLGETGKGAFIGALRAYLTVNWDDPINHSGSKGPGDKLEIVLKDNPNSLSSLSPDPSPVREGSIYDLQGRKLSGKPAKGVYINDGKKYIAQ